MYSVRLVLNILGETDYGVFALVAGVVTMLSFVTNSLIGSTQRFLSVHQGKGDRAALKNVFSNSVILHVVVGLIVLIILECLTPFLFHGFLNIPSDRYRATTILYQMVTLMVYISFITAPYRALLVSRENIVYTSAVDICDGVLKIILVILLGYVSLDKLIGYGGVLLSISLFEFLIFSIYCHSKYEECNIPNIRNFDRKYLSAIGSFTGWITYSTVCITLRNQGLAIVFNKLRGTALNAAYGIGIQISGMVSFVSSSFSNAIAPQIMAAKGANENQRMWFLAELQSKYSYLLLAMVGIPTIFTMESLLKLWLGTVPNYTALFGSTFLIMQIVDMLTSGLGTANRAIGNIGLYTFITFTPKLLIIPLGWYVLYKAKSMYAISILLISVEVICMLLRIPLLRSADGFDARSYCHHVLIKSIAPTIIGLLGCFIVELIPKFSCHFLLYFIVSMTLFTLTAYHCSLSKIEREKIIAINNRIRNMILYK